MILRQSPAADECRAITLNKQHMTSTTPKTYVSTYERYANGSLAGKWIELDQFSSANDFIKHCYKLFNDEELMFQDWENVPDFLVDEIMSKNKLERLFEFLCMDDTDKSIIVAYVDATGNTEVEFCDVFESYFGVANSEAEFAEDYVKQRYPEVNKLPDFIVIDWQGVWESYLQYDFYVGKDEQGEKHFFYQG